MFNKIKVSDSRNTLFRILFFFLFIIQICVAQTNQPNERDNLLSFVMEDFENETFPPAGWALEFNNTLYWTRYAGTSAYGTGSASAQFFNYMAPSGTIQSLVLSVFSSSQSNDSLSFDHAYATFQSENDRLIIETSIDGGNTFSILVTLNGGISGSLVTAPPTVNVFIPTNSQWATKKFGLPLGTNRIRFKAISAYGNNLYLDNISIGTQSSIDIAVQSIDLPNPTLALPQIPKATVKNLGLAITSFTVTMDIAPEGYTSTKTITGGLAGNSIAEILFDEWNPTPGEHIITTYTTLAGDLDNSNDTLVASIQVNQSQVIQNISATYNEGQVFITWDNLITTNTKYILYKSSTPIQFGYQLNTAQNLGIVYGNTSLNKRLSNIVGASKYLKIDSSSAPLANSKGLFVATSTENGSFYYAIIPVVNSIEDTTILIGSNSLNPPISEIIKMPKPVWQENRIVSGKTFEIYVLFATKVTSNIFPQMTNAGTYPYNFAIVKSGNSTTHPVTYYFHPGGMHFLPTSTYFRTVGDPNEWVISIDEWIPGIEGQTNCYGYHEDYDVFSDFNQVPTSGILHNYTAAKVEYIVNWTLKNLPLDSTRTYMTGWSMGAMGALFNSIMLREKIAATFVYAPSFNMALGITLLDRLWGTYLMNLETNEGYSRNERLNTNFLLSNNRNNSLPLIFTFCGKNDEGVGWNEKIAFYDSVNSSEHGGFHFWSTSDHQQVFLNSPWQPNFPNFNFFTRYRTDLSYPAFSNCSINDIPGDGTPSNGDAIGSINGHLDWTDDIIDETNKWEATLYLNNLQTTFGSDIAPDSATTDVTLRRLQNFAVPTDSGIYWINRRNNIVEQQGTFTYYGGPITLQDVKIYKDSCRITVTYSPVSVETELKLPTEFALSQNYPNPFNPSTIISYQLPVSSKVNLKIYDLLGSEVATLVDEEKPAGIYNVQFTMNSLQLCSGVYFYQLKAGDYVSTKKMILIK